MIVWSQHVIAIEVTPKAQRISVAESRADKRRRECMCVVGGALSIPPVLFVSVHSQLTGRLPAAYFNRLGFFFTDALHTFNGFSLLRLECLRADNSCSDFDCARQVAEELNDSWPAHLSQDMTGVTLDAISTRPLQLITTNGYSELGERAVTSRDVVEGKTEYTKQSVDVVNGL